MRKLTTPLWRPLLPLIALAVASAAAEKPAPPANPAPPDQREIWVPNNQIKDILAKYPKAVVLSREQYQTLLRDAKLDPTKEPAAPRRAVLTAAKYQARIAGKVVQVTAALTVNVLSEEWAQIPLTFEGASVGAVQVDGEAAFESGTAPAAQGAPAVLSPALLLRGRGERLVTVEFTIPVTSEAGLSRLRGKLPSAASSAFQLELPPGQRVESPQPIRVTKTPEATSVTAGLSPANPVLELAWRSAGAGALALEPLVMANGIYTIDAEKLRAEFGIAIETQLGNLAEAYRLAIPANAKVLKVTGDELAKWEMAEGRLNVSLQPGERSSAKFWITLEMPSLGNAASATVALPVPRVEGLARMQGVLSMVGDAGVVVKAVAIDGTIQPAERVIDATPHFVASYRFNAAPTAPQVALEKVQPRFSADLDTRVEFKPEAIFIERTLTLHQEKGETFQVALTLPAGEEVMTVRHADHSEPDWRIEDGKVRIRWSERLAGKSPIFRIQTRSEPEKWTQLGADGLTFTLGDAKIDGAEKITGYIALQADDSFRLEAAPSETLERRDGRTTPVQGDYAWFRRQDFSLSVKVAKRPGEVLASLIGYALPLEGVLDLHAQLNFQFLHSGARSVRVQVPEKLAQNFHFDGPQIAERNLVGNIWTVVFQKELTGSYALKVSAQVPLEKSGSADASGATGAQETRFGITVPVIVPLDVVRTSGAWAIEANTETEITFEAKGMNELDSLLAPKLPDYQPRHRVIGVFAWLGKDYALTLSGVRHAPAAVLNSVVDRLDLDTVVSTSGAERNQATFHLRTTGAQYLDVQLPGKSRLLSLMIDDEVVKPVGDRADLVRVQLPAKRDASQTLAVSVLYETPKGEWRRTGNYAARGPKLAKEIPVLRSVWRLFLPEGFEYTGIESNLRVPKQESGRPLVLGPLSLYDEWRLQGARAILSKSGMSDPQAQDQKQVDFASQQPIQQFNVPEENSGTKSRTEALRRKLERIIIPKLEFREATVREVIDFLKKKSVDLDTEAPAAERGMNVVLKLDDLPPATSGLPNPADARITVSLTDIPLIEAMRYATGLANLKFKIEPYAVVVVPVAENTDVLMTKEWKIPPDLIPRADAAKAGSEIVDRESAKNWLIANGLTFNGQASAVYIVPSSRLIIRNTQEQLDLIDTMLPAGGQAAAPQMFGTVDELRVSGLLPMKLDLPKVGRVIELEGLATAEQVEFRYDDWWSRARRLWLWFVGGGLLGLFLAGGRPWWRTCWAVLILTFFPFCVSMSAMPVCNALLAGWLISVVLQRLAVRFVFAPRRKEVLA